MDTDKRLLEFLERKHKEAQEEAQEEAKRKAIEELRGRLLKRWNF